MNKNLLISVLICLALIFSFARFSPAAAEECGSSGSPAIVTDKADYDPFETVVISGSGFSCGEALSVLVVAPDGSSLSGDGLGSPGPDAVTTDENGTFVLSYQLAGSLPDGSPYMGQEGDYTVQVLDSSGAVLASATFSDSVADFSTCALTTGGGVKCWGNNAAGQLGDGTTTNKTTPVNVSGLTSGIVQVSVGARHACALTTSGGVKCWGDNSAGRLGDGTTTNRTTPVDVSGLTSGVAWVSAGGEHTCAVTTGGGAKCWGENSAGRLGDGTAIDRTTPVNVSSLTSGVAQISAGGFHTCALTTGGGVKCWGSRSISQLGIGDPPFPAGCTTSPAQCTTPVDVTGLTSGVAQISAGDFHTCALTTGGGAKCWGSHVNGQLGIGDPPFPAGCSTSPARCTTPVDVTGLTSGVAQISAGFSHTCALTTGGGAKCWGNPSTGQLGIGDPPFPAGCSTSPARCTTPMDVSGLTSGVAQIWTGRHTCALTTGGGAKCWGSHSSGQLGIGAPPFPAGCTTATPQCTTPVDVSGLTSGVAALPDGAPVVSNQPPTANAGGPYLGDEGAPIALSAASASDPDPDTLAYSWVVNSALCSFADASLLNPDLTCSDNGVFTATLSVDDGINPLVSSQAAITVTNVAPTASLGNNGPIGEGGSALVSFSSAFDPSSVDTAAGFHYAFDCNGGSLAAATYAGSGTSDSTSCAFADNGSYPVSGKIMDKDDGASLYTTTITVTNVAPTLGAISVDQTLVQVNTAINASASFTDPGALDTHTAVWDWGDGITTTGTISETGGNGTASASHSYTTPDVYTVKLTVTDNDGAASNEAVYQFVVVYDPDAGFVTGAGWIASPVGAFAANPSLSGIATFGFVSKYQNGATTPTGNTRFQFVVAGFNFQSENYEWLVVNQNDSNAQFKGSGTINGSLDANGDPFKFMLWAGDGTPDTFRIKIWDESSGSEVVVYDNGSEQAIGAGAIKIHD
jgi:alpha-tubulin suppressor-like RCC1 family protein